MSVRAFLVGDSHFIAAHDEAEAISFAINELHIDFDMVEEADLDEQIADEEHGDVYTFWEVIEANKHMVPFLLAVKDDDE